MVKAIIFDFGGVFTNCGHVLIKYAEEHSDSLDKKELFDVLRKLWLKTRISEISSSDSWKGIAEYVKKDWQTVRQEFVDEDIFQEDVLEFARTLKPKYKLGLLSNHIEDWLEDRLKKYNFRDIFDVVVTSYETHLAKPDPRIFQKMLDKLDLSASECIYIDDMEKNVREAKVLEFNAIKFENLRKLKHDLKNLGCI